MSNCGLCGRPVYTGEPICDGCKKSRNRRARKENRKLNWKKKEILEDEEEDATTVWVE